MVPTDATDLAWREDDTLAVDSRRAPAELPASDADTLRLGHLSDFHLGKPLEEGDVPTVVGRWLGDFAEAGVDLVVVSGDLVERPGFRSPLLRIRNLLEESGLPWVVVPGNHDVAHPGQPEAFYELFGHYPRVERRAGLEVVLLDSMGGLPVDERRPFDRLEALRSGFYMQGGVGEAQLERADAMLSEKPSGPRILVVHHHLRAADDVLDDPREVAAPPALMVPCLDARRLLDWAADRDVRLAFHGHRHAHWPIYAAEDRIACLNSGSSTRGKPTRRARIVDLAADASSATVWELAYDGPSAG